MAAAFHLLLLVLAAQLSNDPARIVADLQTAIRADPTKESNYTELGNVLLGTQNFKEAIVVLEHARKRFPNSAQAALSLGVAYYGARRFEDAVGALIDAGKLAPDVEQPVMFLGKIWEHAGAREPEVLERFRAFSAAQPSSALGHFLIGKVTGDEAQLRRSLALANHPETRVELAQVLLRQGKLEAAAAELEQATRLAPRHPEPHYMLFRVYTRMGQTAKATQQKALHEKYVAEERAAADKRQAATKHLDLKVQQP